MEAALDQSKLLALLSEVLCGMREDIALMKNGSLKARSFADAEVTAELIQRVEQRVPKLEAVHAAIGGRDA